MKELEIEVRVRNNLLKARRLDLGYTQQQLALTIGVTTSTYNGLESMRDMPTLSNGKWRPAALCIAAFFDVEPEALWPPDVCAIKKTTAVRHVNVVDVPGLAGIGQHTARSMLPADDDDGLVTALHRSRDIAKVVSTLPAREEFCVRSYFGLDQAPMTFEEIGNAIGRDRERARQIFEKGMRKLRHPSRTRYLRSFIEYSAAMRTVLRDEY